MVRIDKQTLQDLEFPTVLRQISDFCITDPGREEVLAIKPFKDVSLIETELKRVKEFTASFENENRIPNHGFEAIDRELHLSLIHISEPTRPY